MLPGYTLRLLLQGLTLSLLGPACKAASLGLTVTVVPVESDGGRTVGSLCTNTHSQCSHTYRMALESPHYVYLFCFLISFLNMFFLKKQIELFQVPGCERGHLFETISHQSLTVSHM